MVLKKKSKIKYEFTIVTYSKIINKNTSKFNIFDMVRYIGWLGNRSK